MMISAIPSGAIRSASVRATLPVIPWAMLRVHNEHSRAFKGRYSPESNPLGVEIVESQYWPHVRTVDVIGPPQWGKTYHACELPTLFDLCEARETIFYMNGSETNAANIWNTRWLPTLRADPVLRFQLLDRMDGGTWNERRLADGGLLYSAGPESAAALSQRESRIVRCSELEKTRGAIGDEASSYSLARDRAAAYPATHIITSDCTITVRDGLSWRRFVQGDRSRPYIPCPACGHYAVPAHDRHLDDPDLGLTEAETHAFVIPEIAASTPDAAAESVQLVCRACGGVFNDRLFRTALRAVVWVPLGCSVVRTDDPLMSPVPKVTWLDELNKWVAEALTDPDVTEGKKDPSSPPAWRGPRLPDGVLLSWSPNTVTTASNGEDVLPGLQMDPRRSRARSFWGWRIFSPKYTLGQVAHEIVSGETGLSTGDVLDDQKNVSQKCFVLPWVEPILGAAEDLNEDAVLACVTDNPRGALPENTIAITGGIDIGVREGNGIHWVVRAHTSGGESHLIDHGHEETEFREVRKEKGLKWDINDPAFLLSRRDLVYAALDRVLLKMQRHGDVNMTYVDAGYMSEDIYGWCARHSFRRLRPCKGRGSAGMIGRRSSFGLAGVWNDSCEKKALAVHDAKGRPLRHQYFDPADPRHLMFLDADYWKKEVHHGIETTARSLNRGGQSEKNKPWFFLHSELAPRQPVPGSNLRKLDRYVTQVVAKRWEEWVNPRTGRREVGWRVYQEADHLLDAEGYCMAAAAALGLTRRYEPQLDGVAVSASKTVVPSTQKLPVPCPVAAPNRSVRRVY